ncbi:MAG: YigZ family protein [Gemmatimonadaceae bacterium]|nr:YigZ family protein [Chitinophagaceae bacterium]
MTEKDFYFTIDKTACAELKERGSRFIAYAFPIAKAEDFKNILAKIKAEHPKATHHCFGYRLGLNHDKFRVSDDGEPAGSAGRPILGQIDSKELTDVLVIVVRYFGGTLLGIPGLISAYKSAAAMVLQTVPAVQKQVEENYRIQFDYTQMNEIMRYLKQAGCTIIEQEMQLFCFIVAGIPKNRVEMLVNRLKSQKGVEISKVVVR